MRPSYGGTLLAAAILATAIGSTPSWAGSCRAARMCCQGRDSGCVIQKPSPNAIIESPRDKPCYCDHACLKLGDCCDDFNETCSVVDCELSEWSDWSRCDNGCGSGQRTRSRQVLRPERNGGKPCSNEIHQSEPCQNFDACRRRARHFQVEETSFPRDRSGAGTSSDSNFVSQVTRGYCIAFTILKMSRGCRRRIESFHEGSQVCVWCRDDSSSCIQDSWSNLEGFGHWELLNSPSSKHCHGKWMSEPSLTGPFSCSDSQLCKSGPMLAFL